MSECHSFIPSFSFSVRTSINVCHYQQISVYQKITWRSLPPTVLRLTSLSVEDSVERHWWVHEEWLDGCVMDGWDVKVLNASDVIHTLKEHTEILFLNPDWPFFFLNQVWNRLRQVGDVHQTGQTGRGEMKLTLTFMCAFNSSVFVRCHLCWLSQHTIYKTSTLKSFLYIVNDTFPMIYKG